MQAYFIRSLLEYVQQSESNVAYGMIWVVSLFLSDLAMITMLTFQLFLNTRTATRLRAAVIATVYRRAINVRTLKGKSAAEVRVCLRVLLVFTELGTCFKKIGLKIIWSTCSMTSS